MDVSSSRVTRRLWTLAAALALTVVAPLAARAQLVELARSPGSPVMLWDDQAAFDPLNDRFAVVTRSSAAVRVQFFDRTAAPVGTPLVVDDRAWIPFRNFARIAYSADVSNGQGGLGGFMVIWEAAEGTLAQIVSYPGRLVGPRVVARARSSGHQFNADIAYSPLAQTFLLVVMGSSEFFDQPHTIVRLNTSAQPVGAGVLTAPPNYSCSNPEFRYPCEARVVWNPVSGEFGVLYNEGTAKMLARISTDGVVLSKTALGIGIRYAALAVNIHSGNYLAVASSASNDPGAAGAEVGPSGQLLALGTITSGFYARETPPANMDLAYSPASGTFLLRGSGPLNAPYRSMIVELNQYGVALSDPAFAHDRATDIGFGVVVAHDAAPEWFVAVLNGSMIFGTATPFGGSNARLPDCLTVRPGPDWVCVNRGWLPPTLAPPPSPTPAPPPSSGCITPRPGADWVCVGRGWLPPTLVPSPNPSPAPDPSPTGCVTLRPGADWVCVGRGWVPPTHPLARQGG